MLASRKQIKMLDRLRKRSDFLHVQQNGQKWVSKGLIIQAAPNDTGQIRYGLTASRRLSKSAVVRNRIKRRLRAVARDVLPSYAQEGMDYVFIGRPETQRRLYAQLREDLLWSLKKMGFLKQEPPA